MTQPFLKEKKMTKEIITTEKTIDEAVSAGAEALGKTADKVEYEVLEEPRKGILGIGACDAKVRVYYEETPTDIAFNFIQTLINNMQIDVSVTVEKEDSNSAYISITGDNLGFLIGRHGDVLDSLQYLTTLAANKDQSEFFRITVDIENYRAKRAQTLKSLARRMSEKVLKYKRSFALEPMNAYERRIIHSECQNIEGISTYSIGEGSERKIVITLEGKSKKKK